MGKLSFFSGRRLLLGEIPYALRGAVNNPNIKHYPTMLREGALIKCLRCETWHEQEQVKIDNVYETFYYCPACIQLGRVQSNLEFYGCSKRPKRVINQDIMTWTGELTASQAIISQQILEGVQKRQRLLVHAVTGAGKTEMMFKGIHFALKSGWRVGIVSPRVDVCLELFPRLQRVFPKSKSVLLHGKQDEPYHYSSLVVCTTHQLLRFYRAFDVLIVDEVDAFPFVGNPLLQVAVKNAKKRQAAHIMLTATSTPELDKQVDEGGLEKLVLPVRFHGHLLPVPETIWMSRWQEMANRQLLLGACKRLLAKQLERARRTLIFCPTIEWLKKITVVLQTEFPAYRIGSAYAKDPQRHEKISEMREAKYDLFLTTTILERGVTFANIDVIVIGSNHPVFNRASLIQIAGRVGRSVIEPHGSVYFIHDGWTRAMKEAIKEIQSLNQLAKVKGLVKE